MIRSWFRFADWLQRWFWMPAILLRETVEIESRLLLPGRGPDLEAHLSPEERQRIRQTLERLHSEIEKLSNSGFVSELFELAREIGADAAGLVEKVKLWVDLLEELVQAAESHYGSTAKQGRQKARQVKAAVLYLLRKSRIEVPKIPSFLLPLIVARIVDHLITTIVRLLNKYQLWGEPGKAALHVRARRPLHWFANALLGILSFVSQRILTPLFWWLVVVFNPLAPPVREVLDRFLADHPGGLRASFGRLTYIAGWITAQAKDLLTLVDIVAIAVLETEHFLAADGPYKKLYAREMVLIFLAEFVRLPRRSSISFRILELTIDGTIDTIVHLFNKRRLLQPSRRNRELVET